MTSVMTSSNSLRRTNVQGPQEILANTSKIGNEQNPDPRALARRLRRIKRRLFLEAVASSSNDLPKTSTEDASSDTNTSCATASNPDQDNKVVQIQNTYLLQQQNREIEECKRRLVTYYRDDEDFCLSRESSKTSLTVSVTSSLEPFLEQEEEYKDDEPED